MRETESVTMTIGFIDPELEPEERENEAKMLIAELKSMDEVESADPVADPHPPAGSKAFGGVMEGLIATKVAVFNTAKFISYLSYKLNGKPISLEVEHGGKKLKVSASSQDELDAALDAARKFISN
jgi:hypothetical protein